MKIGAQMYTARERCQTTPEFDRAMRRVAEIGYKAVQISGCGNFSARFIRQTADDYGLTVPLTHAAPARIVEETDAVIEEHKIIGAGYIGLGMMPGEYQGSAGGTERFIKAYTPAAAKIARAGLKLMYHNHSLEFERFGGIAVLEWLASGFAPEHLGFTLDTYWVAHGGGDPAFWLKKLKGRVDTVHFKDMSIVKGEQRMAVVGEGNLNWEAVFEAAEESGVKWAFIEQDDCYGEDPFDCLRRSFMNAAVMLGRG